MLIRRTKKLYGNTEAAKFGYVQFEAIRQGMVEEGHSRGYVNETMGRLVRVFRWSASRGLVTPTVPQALGMIESLRKGRTKAPDYDPIRPVEPEVIAKTLQHLPEVVADMVRFQQAVGCRPAEVCMIKPCMVDRSNDVWEIHLDQHKTAHKGKQRVIYVGPRGQAILIEYLLRPANQHCFDPRESEKKRRAARTAARKTPPNAGNKVGSVKTKNRKRPPRQSYDTNSYRRAISRACDKAFPVPEGMDEDQAAQWRKNHRWSPNRVRHTFGTEVRRTEGLEAASLLLGHSDLEVTKIYAEKDRQKAIAAARKVG
ncbi:Tyrosine recombinase XerC [Novipirellula aureliae]|uniref:Tyrosine recombinase XerC n=1 Tax=Novipirellula aureliae TaxID=2527966 RepID=A0A5C6DMP9_9BACT|nr:site-specific integrase [Novipirellula aureliae]TWU37932.1 Tyrosine recombinase XerC [Novipirellula aureliae]